ncbi:MAG: ribonuclease HII [Bacteroidales bacterium]|nr:ribonuclease HII [Bacteroidales bacterium]
MLKSSYRENCIEAGCDEAGRGCLAGAVFAAAVILPTDFQHPAINDSKALSDKERRILREVIEKQAIAWAVESVSPQEIDQINILKASFKAMNLAVEKLKIQPQHLLIDGNRFENQSNIDFTCIIKGDAKYLSIAAASILAKTYRDDYMLELAKQYPQYGWEKNMGYPTLLHRNAIKKYGITPLHRLSFCLLPKQMTLNL